jgi:hypothetical protein
MSIEVTKATKLKPRAVGLRPRCLHCNRELRPNYSWDGPRPWLRGTDNEPDAQSKWDREHKIFLGTYGAYRDNRFCGLNCGYNYAVAHTNPAQAMKS